MDEIRISGIQKESIVDGPGIRYVIFTQGCPHNCKGCHNPQTHDFKCGKLIDIKSLLKDIVTNPLLDGVTLSGGEPFCQAKTLAKMCKILKDMGYNIITYTGYTYEYLITNHTKENSYKDLLNVTDMLIDGKFDIEKRNLMLKFRGSDNQRAINCKESLETNETVVMAI